MLFSHSKVETFTNCPYRYKLRYIDELKTIPETNADNALILGRAMHTGIEKGVKAGIKEYYSSFPVIDDSHINEAIKLEYLIPKVIEILPEGGKFEQQILTEDFNGYMDYFVPVGKWEFDLYDFKYSNNVNNYLKSGQLHEYKHFFEIMRFGQKIRNLYYVMIPKIAIKQKKSEDLLSFRRRIIADLKLSKIQIVKVDYDYQKVIEFAMTIKRILEHHLGYTKGLTTFEKHYNYLCNWCEYLQYCERGIDYMLLPKNERRNIESINKKVVWLYGAPFSGKTYLANKFPDPLMLNTDGNIRFIDSPFISIKDDITTAGRQTNRKFAWSVFKEVIEELEKKENDYKTIVVDLLEDCHEHCRLFMYDKLGITHESDDSFKAWDKVRTEFLSTLKRLMNLDYENIILISHEDRSKDITRKSGDKYTAIKPNIQDKVANKIAGMVDIVARVVADGDERVLSFKTNEVIFGGGRLAVTSTEIPLEYDEFMKVYEDGNSVKNPFKNTSPNTSLNTSETNPETPTFDPDGAITTPNDETPAKPEKAPARPRKRRGE